MVEIPELHQYVFPGERASSGWEVLPVPELIVNKVLVYHATDFPPEGPAIISIPWHQVIIVRVDEVEILDPGKSVSRFTQYNKNVLTFHGVSDSQSWNPAKKLKYPFAGMSVIEILQEIKKKTGIDVDVIAVCNPGGKRLHYDLSTYEVRGAARNKYTYILDDVQTLGFYKKPDGTIYLSIMPKHSGKEVIVQGEPYLKLDYSEEDF